MSAESSDEEIESAAKVLGVAGALSSAKLKAAYRRAMQKWHPDLHQGKDTLKLAEWHSAAINKARGVLQTVPEGTVVGPGQGTQPRSAADRRGRSPVSVNPKEFGLADGDAVAYSLDSQALVAVAYSERLNVLCLKFASGGIHKYRDVPKVILGRFLRAKSKDGFAKRNIVRKYERDRD